MSTIIRVKRHCDEEPQDAFVINCKRRKTNETSDNAEELHSPQATVIKFAATVKNPEDDDVITYCKTTLKSTAATPQVLQSMRTRLREEHDKHMKESRYKVTNLCRSNLEDNTNKEVTIVDVEIEPETKSESNLPESETKPQYVYDLYYTASDDLGEALEVGVYPVTNELVYGSHRDDGVGESDDESSDDSNCENNWRNDYPDEDEYGDRDSVTDEDMLAAVERVNLMNDDLSPDEGESEGFTYSIDSEAAGFEEDIDETDVNRYGERYARFKAKYQKNQTNDSLEKPPGFCVAETGSSDSEHDDEYFDYYRDCL